MSHSIDIHGFQFQLPAKINLGSGKIKIPGYVGVDAWEESSAEVKCDARTFFDHLPENSIRSVYSRMFFEHLNCDEARRMLQEIDRVLIAHGDVKITVPHFSNPYQYSDPTHKSAWAVHSMSYFVEDASLLYRQVPQYVAIRKWVLTRVRVTFRPFFRRFFRIPFPSIADVLNILVNLHPLFIELYERYLCYLYPIYEITYDIQKKERD